MESDITKDYNNLNIVDISPLLASSSFLDTNQIFNSKNIIHETRDTTVSYLDNGGTHMFPLIPLFVVQQPIVKLPPLSNTSPRKSLHVHSNGTSDNTNTTTTTYPINMMLPPKGVPLSIQSLQVAPVNTLTLPPVACVRDVSQTKTTIPLQPKYLVQPPQFIAKTNKITNRFIDNTPLYSVPTKLRNMNIQPQPGGPPVPQLQMQPIVSTGTSSLNAIVGFDINTSYSAPKPYLGISVLSKRQPGKTM